MPHLNCVAAGGGLCTWGRAVLLRYSIWGWKGRPTSPLLLQGLYVLPLGRPTFLVVLASERLWGVLTKISPCGVSFVSEGDARKRSTLVERLGDWSAIIIMDACRPLVPVITRIVRMIFFSCNRKAATVDQSQWASLVLPPLLLSVPGATTTKPAR